MRGDPLILPKAKGTTLRLSSPVSIAVADNR
jgi:hypothetical protein